MKTINCPEKMSEAIRHFGLLPFFENAVPGWSVQEMTAPGCWFFEEEDELGPWDWKIDVVREGDIAYGKFLGGKAAFATVPFYRELMHWRRSLPKYRVALGERKKATSARDRLMQILSPIALQGIREAGALEAQEIRRLLTEKITPAQIRSMGPKYKAVLSPVKKTVVDSVMQFLQMGTWSVIGDITRVYRGPELTYNGWQRASNTTPDDLFARDAAAGEVPFWAHRFEEAAAAPSVPQGTPEAARDRLIAHVQGFFPEASRAVLEKMI